MAFPSYDRTRSKMMFYTADTTFEAFCPGVQFDRDQLVIVAAAANGSCNLSASAGWSELSEVDHGSSTITLAIYYKVADGYGNDDLTITASASVGMAILAITIDDADGTSIDSASTTGSSASPDSPSLSPSGGSADYLWLSIAASLGWSGPHTPPTNFTEVDDLTEAWGDTDAYMNIAYRQYTGSVLNPAAWGFTISGDWIAFTIALSYSAPDSDNYGIKTWDSSGNLRLDTTDRGCGLVYTTTASSGVDGNSGALSEIDGRDTVQIAIAQEAGAEASEQVPHYVYRSSNTIYWEAMGGGSSVDSTILVFCYG